MPEVKNVEVAHELSHRPAETAHQKEEKRRVEMVEILEALLLAVVAVVTAWSGYQSARWDGRSALDYGQASRASAQANQLATAGGQQKILDVTTFNTWVDAVASGHPKVAALYVQRFSPEYRVAFDAWLKTDPLHNPHSPPGPSYMPQYHNHLLVQSATVSAHGTALFEQGTTAREFSENYVRTTVLLAAVLFLVAISQRFDLRQARLGLLGVGLALLAFCIYTILTYPVS
jgi:hypothetical protein